MVDCKKFPGSTSMNMVLNNYDLLTEILIRLPAKSVIRFTSVSKQWRSIVSATSFRIHHTLQHHHSHRQKPLTSLILQEKYSKEFFLCHLTSKHLIPFNIGLEDVEILQSCNGLLLLRSSKGKDCYVCNPTTMQLRKFELEQRTSHLCLVFDPSKSTHYKVICFRKKSSSHWVETYDSETRTWRKGAELPCVPNTLHNVVYWNEEIYYIRPRSASQRFILNDRFYEVPSPPWIYRQGSRKNYVMESNGHMHCVALPARPHQYPVVVLEMDKTNLTWSEKYHFVFPGHFSSSFYSSYPAMDVLGVMRGEKEEDSMLLFALPGKIVIYKFFDKTFEEIVRTRHKYRNRFVGSHLFVETLVPV